MMIDGMAWLAKELRQRPIVLDQVDAKVVRAIADCNMKVSEAARRLYMHRNTVLYRVRKIHQATEKDPLNFYDLCELLPIARQVPEI